jgi:FMN reductase
MNPNGYVVVVVANPGGPGRTGGAALQLADRIAAFGGRDGHSAREVVTIDLADRPERLLAFGSPLATEHRSTIEGGRALVVATPTYKATYTGLLKIFLDQVGAGELAGIPTVALMTGGSDAHALAVDVHLAPLLAELGASLPVRGLYLSGAAVDEPGAAIDAWWRTAEAPLKRALGG